MTAYLKKTTLVSSAVAAVIILALIVLLASAYRLSEVEQAVILQFGAPVGDPITEPGLHFRTPFIQEVRKFDKRLLSWDGDPNQIPTRGREFISVDTTARWRIVDPLTFLRSVHNETGAHSRLDDIIDSVVRDMISSTELSDIVRSQDWDIAEEDLELLDDVRAEEVEDITEEVRVGREELTQRILEEASRIMPSYGIELRDVRIKRINYIPSVREQVFTRMVSERQRVAERFRAEGRGESSEIIGEMRRELKEIMSAAERRAEIMRGEADAEATRIYNEAYGEDPRFYAFFRTLESYPRVVGENMVLLLDSGDEFWGYLRNPGMRTD